jgi:NAD-dependent deacetylase
MHTAGRRLHGAGMSTESGLPDFRSNGGLWKQSRRFEELASVDALESDYDEHVGLLSLAHRDAGRHEPNDGHASSPTGSGAAWSDRRHAKRRWLSHAGGRGGVLELHGTLADVRCHRCGGERPAAEFLRRPASPARAAASAARRRAVRRGAAAATLRAAQAAAKRASLFIVLGSSLAVVARQPPAPGGGRRGRAAGDHQPRSDPARSHREAGDQRSIGETLRAADGCFRPSPGASRSTSADRRTGTANP